MKHACKIALLLFPLLLARQLMGGQQGPCFQRATTQKELNDCAAEDFRNADAELNEIYRKVLLKYSGDAQASDRIKKAQQAWIAFRDAHIDSLFQALDKVKYGSVYEMCRLMQLTNLTTERTRMLKAMLEPKEGDVCKQ